MPKSGFKKQKVMPKSNGPHLWNHFSIYKYHTGKLSKKKKNTI